MMAHVNTPCTREAGGGSRILGQPELHMRPGLRFKVTEIGAGNVAQRASTSLVHTYRPGFDSPEPQKEKATEIKQRKINSSLIQS